MAELVTLRSTQAPSVLGNESRKLRRKYFRAEGTPMFVTVIPRIHDPKGFEAAEAKALEAGLPSHVALPIQASNDDHFFSDRTCTEIYIQTLREAVQSSASRVANKEYCAGAVH